MSPLSAIDPQEEIARVRLIRSENVGPITFRALLDRYGAATAALEALPDLARRGGKQRRLKVAGADVAETELAAAQELGAQILHLGVDGYPAPLAAVDGAPALLYLLGSLHLLDNPMLAVVGGRGASVAGRAFAEKIARDLGAAGFSIVSGMARGIDAAAHAGALDTGTVAVMAGGVDAVFPPENQNLYGEIAARGAALSEEPPGMKPIARHFPKRNRIISGLSLGVVVIEAKARSGTLITARTANEQGRQVFAVPGAPADPRSAGGNGLIRQGATLIQNAQDVLDEIRPSVGAGAFENRDLFESGPIAATEADIDQARRPILEGLSHTPVALDAFCRTVGVSPSVALCVILELELAGLAQRGPGGVVSLR
ncbi:MAG: DNA-processing protein DprA [Alphaproteobacteria bacterium]|nr:DNA-processing protein DprA [Alphaproteobacteria bacterium]